ncbi:hypothetical protein PWR63_25635 [Paraburkholderia sp. A2WS-5]|uniref:hypothetical protein n=1 Tax=unclassified Paraburkholderia TaxID=2615204 RepID=UPI003B81B184
MHSDDELAELADDIKLNGLRCPVTLGIAVVEEGTEPTLCVVAIAISRRQSQPTAGSRKHAIPRTGRSVPL